MKITLEQAENKELEIIIRGNLADSKISTIISSLNNLSANVTKLMLYREDDEKEYLYDISEITYFSAYNNKVFAKIGDKTFVVHYKLYELADMLHSKGFIQISKGVVLNTNYVSSVEAEFSGNYIAILKNKKDKLVISRKYMKDFRKYIMEGI